MKILLYMPYPRKKDNSIFSRVIAPCLSLEQIAALIPEGHDVEIVDERLEKLDINQNYDLVGISCMTYNSLKGYEIADEFRKKGAKVVLGGYHPSSMSEEAKQHADSVVIGEAEYTWPVLLDDLENGNLKPFYKSDELVNPQDIPAAIHEIDKYKNQLVESIQASRGCPVGCEFCAMQTIEGRRLRGRPIENVIDEMKGITKRRIFFTDASLTGNPAHTKNLFREMKELDKQFAGMGNVNIPAKDDEFLKLAGEAGCVDWLVGLESISQDTINSVGKTTNKIEDYSSAIEKFHDYGIRVIGSFIFGFDTDTPDVFEKTYEFIEQIDIDIVEFNILTPLPGSPIFKKFERENRLLTRDWSKYTDDGGEVVFQPKSMSREELVQGITYIHKEFNSFFGNIGRMIRTKNIDFWSIFRSLYRHM